MAATYYNQLGITPSASTDDIKRAYRSLARQYHPDVDPNPSAAARFTQISKAYAVLVDARKRLAYNQSVLAAAVTSSIAPILNKSELWAAWRRVGSYALTGGMMTLVGIVGARWVGGAEPMWAPMTLWLPIAIGVLLGTLWGIDANFVVADFVARPMLWVVRLIRFIAWPSGTTYLVLNTYEAAVAGHRPIAVPLQAELGLLALGGLVALVATLRDH